MGKYMKIGEKIRTARQRIGMTQSELARKVGVSSPTVVSQWEHGADHPRGENLVKLTSILSLPPDWFVEEGKIKEQQHDYMREPPPDPDLEFLLQMVRQIHRIGNEEVLLALRQDLRVYLLASGKRRDKLQAWQRVGQILLRMGFVTEEQLREALLEQLRELRSVLA